MISIMFRTLSWFRLSLLYVSLTLLFSGIGLAQGSSSNSAEARSTSSTTMTVSSSTISAPAQTHTVQVGLDHKFKPDVTVAAIGDTIEFGFYPLNHSVIRAEYRMPCVPYEMLNPFKAGFFSGFYSVGTVLDDPPTWSLRVNNTDPIFFYCSAPGSCLTYGMVGAINPSKNMTISTQHELAMNSTFMLNPGEPWPAEAPTPSEVLNATSTPAPSAASTSAKRSLSPGTIAGIVVGALTVITLFACLFFFWGRIKSLKDEVDRKAGTVRRTSPNGTTVMSEPPQVPQQPTDGLGLYQHYSPTPPPHAPSSPPPPPVIYQHHQSGYNTPAPAYFSPPLPAQTKFDLVSPTGHPAYQLPTLSSSPLLLPSNSPPPQTYSNFSHPSPLQRDSSRRSVDGTFELHPAGDYTRSVGHAQSLDGQGSASPQTQSQSQSQTEGRKFAYRSLSPALSATRGPAPSYFESVHRPGPLHLNQQIGPAEMEARSVAGEDMGGGKF